MKHFERTLITAALPYANGPVHIGHLAGVYIPADIYARYLRLNNRDVLFICGSDEHGVPISLRARKEGITPQQLVNKYHVEMQQAFQQLGISFDIYSRTSNAIHYETASEFFKTLHNKGLLQEQTSEQYYDEHVQKFLADRYIVGTCPNCNFNKAYGDQCEKCGTALSPDELINPVSALSSTTPVKKSTTHWYMPLNNYEGWLREWILESHKEDWKPNVYGQCKSWLDAGLQPRAITRDLDWGVPVPLPNTEGKVIYVWFEAPIGYISATRELTEDWEKYWKDPASRIVHFIGKDNIVFHCIIFPAMLKAEGSYNLPDQVPANEFLNLEGEKISTSRNWAVWLHEYLEDFNGKPDWLRYVLTANAPETKDNDFTWKDFQTRVNTELVAILGNFTHRVITLVNSYYNGVAPSIGDWQPQDTQLQNAISNVAINLTQQLERYHFRDALKSAIELARLGNKYLADEAPWKNQSTNPQRVATTLNLCLQLVANLTIALEPFLPSSMAQLRQQLNFAFCSWSSLGSITLINANHKIEKPAMLFEKVEDEVIKLQVEKLHSKLKAPAQTEKNVKVAAAPLKPNIAFDVFEKLDLRIGTIIEAEPIVNANKLLKLTIDLGVEQRTVVSGIAQHYALEALKGQQVCLLVNLEPRTLKGVESQGMILMATNSAGKPIFIAPPNAFAEDCNGSFVS